MLGIYGDSLITAPFNRTAKSVEQTFVILKTGDPNLMLKLERIGPLGRSKP